MKIFLNSLTHVWEEVLLLWALVSLITAKECLCTSWNCVRNYNNQNNFLQAAEWVAAEESLNWNIWCAQKGTHYVTRVWPPVCLFAGRRSISERKRTWLWQRQRSSSDIKYFCSLSCHSSCTKLDVWAQFMVNLLQECHSIKARA